MKLILLILLSCLVAQSVSSDRIRIPSPVRIPSTRIPTPFPQFPNSGKRDVLPADVDSDQDLEDAEISFEELARLFRELPENDETARSVDDFNMIDHDPQENE